MSKFRNKSNNEIVEANSFTELFAFSHNSNYELVEEPKEDKKEKNNKVGKSKEKKRLKNQKKVKHEKISK